MALPPPLPPPPEGFSPSPGASKAPDCTADWSHSKNSSSVMGCSTLPLAFPVLPCLGVVEMLVVFTWKLGL